MKWPQFAKLIAVASKANEDTVGNFYGENLLGKMDGRA